MMSFSSRVAWSLTALLVFSVPANAGPRSNVAFDLVAMTYATLMSKAEFCELTTRFELKGVILGVLAEVPGVNIPAMESRLDTEYRLERDRLPPECQPDVVRLYFDTFVRDLANLEEAIANEF